jgi:hypothetical protein
MTKTFCDACGQEIFNVVSQMPLTAPSPNGGVPFGLTAMPTNPNQLVCATCVISALKLKTS